MSQVKFSLFNSQFDTVVQPQEMKWPDFKDLFSTHAEFTGDKTHARHFNGAEFHTPYRTQINVRALHVLVLDFDDGLSTDEAKQLFTRYEYILYTSYNHQREKAGKPPVDKFRIILLLNEPCPLEKWLKIRHHVLTLFPTVDICSIRLHQPFCIPIHHPDAQYETWVNEGEYLDWSDWPEQETVTLVTGDYTYDSSLASDEFLLPDQILQTKNGMIRVDTIDRKISGVLCPFHADCNPSEFVSKSPKGSIYLHCSTCAKTYYMKTDRPFEGESKGNAITEMVAASHFKPRNPNKKITKEEITPVIDQEDEPCIPYDRKRRERLITRKCLRKSYKVMSMYAFEGFGKSRLAFLEAKRGKRVLFCSMSNEQSLHQAKGFEETIERESPRRRIEAEIEIGVLNKDTHIPKEIKVQAILGREYQLRMQYGIDAVCSSVPKNPWDSEYVNKDKTLLEIASKLNISAEEAQVIWNECEPELIDPETNIICTTMARSKAWGKQQEACRFNGYLKNEYRIVPEDTLIFFDDPSREDLTQLYPYSDRWKDTLIQDQPIKTVEVNRRKYFVRPDLYKIGHGFRENKLIFTTTELITNHLINTNYNGVYNPTLMPDQKMIAGNITMIKTDIVRAKKDGLLPGISCRLKKEGFDFEFIGDGMGLTHNLQSSKGKNSFSGKNIIIEISTPHFSVANLFVDELGWDTKDRNVMAFTLALDDAQQAIGRVGGYRTSDNPDGDSAKIITLVEPNLFKNLIKHMRYLITTEIPDVNKAIGLKRDYQSLTDALLWYIRNVDQYLMSGIDKESQAFLTDTIQAVENTQTLKRLQMMKRVCVALENVIKRLAKTEKKSRNIEYALDKLAARFGKLQFNRGG